MVTRIITAFIILNITYLIATLMYSYDGIVSIIITPIIGSIITAITILIILVFFSPLLIQSIWDKYRKLWQITAASLIISVLLIVMSSLPNNKIFVEIDGKMTESYNHSMAFLGWLLLSFSLLWNPAIGFSKNKKWY